MRSQRRAPSPVAQRRLELLRAELASLDPGPGDSPDVLPGGAGPEPAVLPAVPAAEPSDEPRDRAPARGRHALRPRPRGERASDWVGERLPPTLRGRVALGPAQLVVVLLLAVTALAAARWWAGSTQAEFVAAPRASSAPAAPAPPAPSPVSTGATGSTGSAGWTVPGVGTSPAAAPSGGRSAATGGQVVVDVAGRVRRPGIVVLPAGSRVADALDAAGGARRGVELVNLNLARVLADGEQVLVGLRPVPGYAAAVAPPVPAGGVTSSAPAAPVDLNTATLEQLDTLPGVGPVTGQAILDWRTEHGSFSSVDELLEVSGIGDATLAELRPLVTV